MTDDDLLYMTATSALAAFSNGSLSPVDVMTACVERAGQVQPHLNCFTDIYFDAALDAAKTAEKRWADGTARRLEGLPLAVKEEFRLAGTRRTSSSLLYPDRVDIETDIYIQRLLDEGAIPIAKTTTPEFCYLGTTHSRLFGVTTNPWHSDYSPGGSSGGSGAALATGSAMLATGTDIGGSIRIPASACGVVGYKPPYGRNPEVEIYNLDYYSHSGPMARSVGDCAWMQNITSGQHVSDIASLRDMVILDTEYAPNLKGCKVAFSVDFGFYEVDAAVHRNTLAALDVMRDLGAIVEEVDLGWTKAQADISEMHLDHQSGAGLVRLLEDHRDQLCDYIVDAAEASLRSTAEDFLCADEAAIAMYRTLGPVLEEHDVFVCPTLTLSAPPAAYSQVNTRIVFDGTERDMAPAEWEITRLFNMLSRCPVLSVPSGFDDFGVPTGIQIVGKAYHDEGAFQVAGAFEAANSWFASSTVRPRIGDQG